MQCPKCNTEMRFNDKHVSLIDNDRIISKETTYYCPHCNDYITVSANAECPIWSNVKFFSDKEGELL